MISGTSEADNTHARFKQLKFQPKLLAQTCLAALKSKAACRSHAQPWLAFETSIGSNVQSALNLEDTLAPKLS